MISKNKKKFYQSLKAISSSTLSRKKNSSTRRVKNIKQLNRKLKLQFINYKLFSSVFKYISIYNSFTKNLNFIFF